MLSLGRHRVVPLIAAAITALATVLAVPSSHGQVPGDGPALQEPQTPEALFDAVLINVSLGRHDVAREYLQQLLEAEVDAATWFALRQEHGSALFARLATVRELQPESVELMRLVNEAALRFATEPARLRELIDLLSASPSERTQAIVELRAARAYAVPYLLAAVQDPVREAERANIIYAIVRLGTDAVPPLIAGLESPDARLRATVASALGQLGDTRAVPFLWGPAADPEQPNIVRLEARRALEALLGRPYAELPDAGGELLTHTRQAYHGWQPWPVSSEGSVEVWVWDATEQVPVPVRLAPHETASLYGSLLARQALDLRPAHREAQVLFLSMGLEADYAMVGIDGDLPIGPGTPHDAALSAGPDLLVATLRQAMTDGRPAVALAAVRLLGQIGSEELYQSAPERPAPLIEAINYPDRRVQFAAAEAILRLRPREPFAGSGRVVSVLSRSAAGYGQPRAIVGDTNLQRGRELAGMVQSLGYEVEVVATGRDVFTRAVESADFELIFLDPNIAAWPLSETLANLTADARTAGLPIFLVGTLEIQPYLMTYANDLPRVRFVVRPPPGDVDGLREQVDAYLAELSSPPLSDAERDRYADRAVRWLVYLTQSDTPAFDLEVTDEALRTALFDPALADQAALALGSLPTHDAQRSLAEVTLNGTAAAEARRTAASQLAYSIRRFGLVLTSSQLADLHTLYAGTDDPELHSALAAVLGALRPNEALAGERLQQVRPQPAANE